MNEDGTQYTSDQKFTCKAQADGFKALLDNMAARPQDYVSDRGRLTTNSVEGFHGLALLYRGKRTDLGHMHMCARQIWLSVTRCLPILFLYKCDSLFLLELGACVEAH